MGDESVKRRALRLGRVCRRSTIFIDASCINWLLVIHTLGNSPFRYSCSIGTRRIRIDTSLRLWHIMGIYHQSVTRKYCGRGLTISALA